MPGDPETWPAFDRATLTAAGFRGWVPFRAFEPGQVPAVGGVYVIVRPGGGPPAFLERGTGGRFKGRDPAVDEAVLRANWVPGACVVYIGKGDDLRRRLREFAAFGAGRPVGHWGGRLVWQLDEAPDLLVAWKGTAPESPRAAERRLIEAFRRLHGKPPFANEPHRLGRPAARRS